MLDIKMCIICWKSDELSAQINSIKEIEGLTVNKRSNKPFYDVIGVINIDDLHRFARILAELLKHDAELEIEDEHLRETFLTLVAPLIEE